MARVLLNQM
uniref:Uncharacterized protein n=1 Tax=Arundo donax TaxID=35708 RepID=A0A0A9E6J2_ARUDO